MQKIVAQHRASLLAEDVWAAIFYRAKPAIEKIEDFRDGTAHGVTQTLLEAKPAIEKIEDFRDGTAHGVMQFGVEAKPAIEKIEDFRDEHGYCLSFPILLFC